MSKSTQYILTGKRKITSINGAVYEKGELLTADQVKKLSKRQAGFCEEFNPKDKTHRKLSKVHHDEDISKPLDGDALLSGEKTEEEKAAEKEEAEAKAKAEKEEAEKLAAEAKAKAEKEKAKKQASDKSKADKDKPKKSGADKSEGDKDKPDDSSDGKKAKQ